MLRPHLFRRDVVLTLSQEERRQKKELERKKEEKEAREKLEVHCASHPPEPQADSITERTEAEGIRTQREGDSRVQ